jgi:hypothetical protein
MHMPDPESRNRCMGVFRGDGHERPGIDGPCLLDDQAGLCYWKQVGKRFFAIIYRGNDN